MLDQDAYALSLNLYLVAALAAIVLAGAGLAVNLAVQMPDRRRDAASMRVVGVRRRQISGRSSSRSSPCSGPPARWP